METGNRSAKTVGIAYLRFLCSLPLPLAAGFFIVQGFLTYMLCGYFMTNGVYEVSGMQPRHL